MRILPNVRNSKEAETTTFLETGSVPVFRRGKEDDYSCDWGSLLVGGPTEHLTERNPLSETLCFLDV
jgi:hypothetical protein